MKTLNKTVLIYLVLNLFLMCSCSTTKSMYSNAEKKPDKNYLLVRAVEMGNVIEVKRLLETGADINTKNRQGWTILNIAIYNGYIDVIKLLIEKGVDINARYSDNWTPLKIAIHTQNEEVIELLKNSGAKE
ncbi:MAG: ankyrin repeat domain-containing protein [bacterium]|nr:ankyrin repeat domain-containing protein [bacterium]